MRQQAHIKQGRAADKEVSEQPVKKQGRAADKEVYEQQTSVFSCVLEKNKVESAARATLSLLAPSMLHPMLISATGVRCLHEAAEETLAEYWSAVHAGSRHAERSEIIMQDLTWVFPKPPKGSDKWRAPTIP